MNAPALFSQSDRDRLKDAVSGAEAMTSGEIRVYIEDDCKTDVLDRAAFIFAELNMHLTDLRNGVLIYLAVSDRKFAIIGDAGIHAKVGDDFWKSIKHHMATLFKEKKFTEGLEYGILESGKALQQYFPFSEGDKNELPDDLIFGEDK
jgi:uncharacterized membrane protein